MYIEVITEISSEERELYKFNCFDTKAVFVGFSLQFKPKGKRVWKNTKWWDKYNSRDCNLEEPILSSEIKQEALEKIQAMCKVLTWSEYKKI